MPKYPPPAPAETVRGAMHGFLLRRPRDPLALKLAAHCQSPSASPSTSPSPFETPSRPAVPGNNALSAARDLVVAVRVAQGRRLAVRPLLEPMYARHGLRTRYFLVRDGYGRVGCVAESERNTGGSMRHPVWTRTLAEGNEMLRLPVEGGVAGVSLAVEVVCGILVVASAVVELEKVGGRAEPRWTPLKGDAGLLELALAVEEGVEEVEEDMPLGTSAWVHKLAEQSEDDDDDELTLEYSSSSDELDGGVVEEQQALETRGEEAPAVEEDGEWRRREAERRRRVQLLPDGVTVARAGATTMYFPRQAGGRGGNEQERLLDKQLWDLYAFGIAAHAPGRAGDNPDDGDGGDERGEASPRASEVSQSASTCASDVLGFNQFIQNLEAAKTRERLAKSPEQHEQRGDNQEAGQAVDGGGSHPEQPETNATAQPTPVPVRRRALEPSPRPREGVVLFDPASLSSPLAPEAAVASRRQQRRGSVMPGAEAARAKPEAGARRRRSLPINAVYAQLQRKLLAGVQAIRRQSQPQPPPQPPTPSAVPQAELTRKRSMSLHAVTDLFRPERLDLTDASRHRSNSSGDSRSAFSSSSSSHSTSPFSTAPPSSRRSSAGASAVVFLQGEPLRVGRRILVGRASPGVVLYIGPVRFAAGAWLGVALDEPKGKTDGVVDGVRYFTCAPGHGILLRASRLDLRLLPSPGDDA